MAQGPTNTDAACPMDGSTPRAKTEGLTLSRGNDAVTSYGVKDAGRTNPSKAERIYFSSFFRGGLLAMSYACYS